MVQLIEKLAIDEQHPRDGAGCAESDAPAAVADWVDQVLRVGRKPAAATTASIILPAYNEAEALPEVLRSLHATIGEQCEVLVVDDGSSDGTGQIASQYPCRLLTHERNQGKGAAVRTGIRAARGQSIIIMDADNTYPADAVPHMISLLAEYDFVRGIRSEGTSHIPLLNRIGNSLFNTILRCLHGLEGTDHLTGLYGLEKSALERLDLTSNGFDLEVEIGIKARTLGLRSTSFPIKYGPRLGEKKLSAWRDGLH
ncbi:MAG: glycosyltransferase family 2 protein, partial [Chloroflexota bacterium]|nr:glycosyltransferase family 2 protein [Chloroflexota bacterium]